MALNDEIREQRQKLKGKGKKAYIEYYLEYYLWRAIAVIAAAVLIGSVIHGFVTDHPDAVYAVLLNCRVIDSWVEKEIEGEVGLLLGTNPRKEDVVVETTFYRTPGTMQGQADMATDVKMMALSGSGDIDLLAADAYLFRDYATAGGMLDLRDVLDKEELESLDEEGLIWYLDAGDIHEEGRSEEEAEEYISAEEGAAFENPASFTLPIPEQMKDPIPVGIVLTGRALFEKYGMYPDAVVAAGFPSGTSRLDNAKVLLEYLMSDDPSAFAAEAALERQTE